MLIPVNNGQPRLKKTPLGYWCIAGLARLLGDQWVTELTVRLPSAISAVLCALVVLALGRYMFGWQAAFLAAVMFATTVGFQKWGRRGRPDMLMCLLMTAAMACLSPSTSSA